MYKGTKVLDVHGHVTVPPGSNAFVATLLGANSLTRSPLITGAPGATEAEYRASAARHVAYMDEREIDVQVIGPRPFMALGQVFPRHSMQLWAEHVNLTIAQQVSWYPDRFLGACLLPQDCDATDATHMLATLEHGVGELGFVATYVSPDPKGQRTTPGLNEPYWYPLYEKCVDLDVPIIVHGTNTVDPRHYIVPHNYQLGFMAEQYLALQILSHADVFERFPELRIMICHCGGALHRFIASDPHLGHKDLRENLFFDTCAHDIDFLTAAIRQRGVAQVAFGSEAPGSGGAVRQPGEGPGKTGDDLVPVIDSFDWLSEKDKLDIFHGNPLKLVPGLARLA